MRRELGAEMVVQATAAAGGTAVPGLNPVRAVTALIPEPGPKRTFVLATLVNTYGLGLLVVSMPLYFTRVVGLPVGQVGLGLTIAVGTGLLAGVPIGDLADRRGPLATYLAVLLVQFAVALAFLFIRNFAGFVVVAVADTLALTASFAAGGALLRRVGGDDAVGFRASAYAVTNLGLALGSACSAIALQIDTPTAYHLLIIINAVTCLGAWVILRGLPNYDPLPKPASATRWGVLSDRAFVAYTVLAGGMSLRFYVITLLLPLWVVEHTHAPRWSIPIFLLINTMLVVLFQVRVGSRVKTIRQGGVAIRRSGVIFLVSCSVIGLAAGLSGWVALLLLVASVCLHTFGGLWHQAGSFALNLGLPPAHAQGQYEGFVLIGTGIGGAIAPVLLLGLVLSLGRPGVLGLGAFFALVGLLMPAVTRWGERTRPAAPDVVGLEPVP
ncbi:MAG: MFS transporter [Jatrophihabitantaceae bacterium]